MRNKMRAARRPKGGQVASCDTHLGDAMRRVTSPVDGHDNDTHVVIRRLGSESEWVCDLPGHPGGSYPAAWVLIPQAVLR